MLWSAAWAAYGNGAGRELPGPSANWMVTILGPGIFVIGVIMVGINGHGRSGRDAQGQLHDQGRALIFLSQAVVALLKRLAGGF